MELRRFGHRDSGSNKPPLALIPPRSNRRAMYMNRKICGANGRDPAANAARLLCCSPVSPLHPLCPPSLCRPLLVASSQLLDLTFSTLCAVKKSLSNSLISRVCTTLHVNQRFFPATPSHQRKKSFILERILYCRSKSFRPATILPSILGLGIRWTTFRESNVSFGKQTCGAWEANLTFGFLVIRGV
jgi:hypothetical protein